MYTQEFIGQERDNAASVLDLTAAAVDGEARCFLSKCKINRIAVAIKTATVSNVTIVVTFKKYLKPGDNTNAVTLGTVKIPTATAAGKVLYKDITPAVMNAGDSIVYEVTTAAGGGGAAGVGIPLFEGEYVGEAPANQANMVASA